MGTFDEKLNKHIDKVIALQNTEKEKMLSLEELKETDLSLGVTEEEWQQMMQKADDELKLAHNHFYYKNYKDAYSTAESAVSINPHLTEATILMADTALKIYETEDNEDYILKAENHAKEVLKSAPAEKRAIEILAILNKYKKKEKTDKEKLIKIIAIVVGAIIIISSFIYFKPKKEKKIDQTVKFELIDAEENANAKWAQVENVISRRNKLIPQLLTLAGSENEQVNTYKKEIETLKKEIKLASDNEKINLQAKLQTKYEELTKLISQQNNSENIKTLMIQIEGSYNRISTEGKRYNDAVKNYNILVKKEGHNYKEFKIKPYFKGQ